MDGDHIAAGNVGQSAETVEERLPLLRLEWRSIQICKKIGQLYGRDHRQ
jgi:hypothetical protein